MPHSGLAGSAKSSLKRAAPMGGTAVADPMKTERSDFYDSGSLSMVNRAEWLGANTIVRT